MSSLKPIEKRGFEDLFNMASGFVLDFSNASFAQLFEDVVGMDIYDRKYEFNGDSKAKRLRAFWEVAPDDVVGKVLDELLDAWEYEHPKDTGDIRYKKCREATLRLRGQQTTEKSESAEEFLNKKIELPNISKLNLDSIVTQILDHRIGEIEKALNARAPLSVIFLCGSVLEGVLLGAALQKPKSFNQSISSPKDKTGKVQPLHEWKLATLIDVACDIGAIELDVKKFSHALRDFRNYIHPYEQMSSGFTPKLQTAEICFQVLKAAISDLSGDR